MSEPPNPAVDGRGLHVDAVVELGGLHLELAAHVPAGQVLGVLGPNGAGKTTLLRALAGLVPLTRGRIEVAGRVWDDPIAHRFVPVEHRPVGFVFQDYRLFPHLDVRDNVAFSPRVRGAGRAAARRTAQDWLHRLDLTDLAARRPHQLSGGQAQRVALARALAADPQLLLLDEPLAALDARTRTDVRAQLRRHLTHFTGPVLIVTHDPLEAMVMTDRLLVIEDGRIVQHGSPAAVARRPATQYVARLVGLNLYAGTLNHAGSVVDLEDGGTMTIGPAPELPDSARVLVALQPAAITLSTARPERSSSRNIWPGTITGMELLTDRVRVQVHGEPPALVDITAAAAADLDLQEGATVWLSAKATETTAYGDRGSTTS